MNGSRLRRHHGRFALLLVSALAGTIALIVPGSAHASVAGFQIESVANPGSCVALIPDGIGTDFGREPCKLDGRPGTLRQAFVQVGAGGSTVTLQAIFSGVPNTCMAKASGNINLVTLRCTSTEARVKWTLTLIAGGYAIRNQDGNGVLDSTGGLIVRASNNQSSQRWKLRAQTYPNP